MCYGLSAAGGTNTVLCAACGPLKGNKEQFMAYIALYRKWRPASFDEVKGQDPVVETLRNQIETGRIGHAYLFCGSRGTGKTSVAKIFAKAVNCENPSHGSPCGECAMCRAVDEGNSVNVIEIDAASNNGVDNIREIRDEVQYRPAEGKYRVYIIDEVHMLSAGAFNALLKTLEEPPSYVIFILATTEPQKIPLTVLSRCQRYDFRRITTEDIIARLNELAAGEGVEAEDKAIAYISRKADGGLRDAISLLDQCIAYRGNGPLSYEKALEALGTVDSDMLSRFLRAMLMDDTSEALNVIEAVRIEGRDLSQFVQDFIWYLRNLLLLMTAEATGDLLEMSGEDWMRLAEEAKLTDPEDLMRLIRLFSSVFNDMRAVADKRVLLEVAAIKATRPAMETDVSALAARVLDLEQKLENGNFSQPQSAEKVQSSPQPAVAQEKTEERVIPRADWENLQEIKNRWKQLLRRLPYQAAWPLGFTWLEPRDNGVMGIVFTDRFKYNTALRFRSVELLKKALEQEYGRTVEFDIRTAGSGESEPRFVTDEDLAAIHMEIEMED